MHHHTKCRADWLAKLFRRYGHFSFFKMAAVRHLGFSKIPNRNCWYAPEGQFAKFDANRTTCCGDMDFLIFQDGSRPPYWICYRHIGTTRKVYLVISIIVQNFVGIDAVVSTMWTF